jgi:hypothetical protein
MKICRHMAMTRWEMENSAVPEGFSPAFLPWEEDLADLPKGTLLVLHDQLPLEDPAPILEAVKKSEHCGILLDFQKPGQETLIKYLLKKLPPTTALSELYAKETDNPVFLPPCPPDRPLEAHIAPWKGREIWLDTAPEVLLLTLKPTGCAAENLLSPPNSPHFTHETLCCRYKTEIHPTEIRFTLWRDKQMLEAHMEQAQTLGVTKTIGLFQEWKSLL